MISTKKSELTYSFKHLVFLQLQRLQPSLSTVLDDFFLKNCTEFTEPEKDMKKHRTSKVLKYHI